MTTETAPALATELITTGKAVGRRRRPARATLWSILKHAGLIAVSLLMLYPLIWLVVSSLKPNDEIFRDLSIFTTNLTLDNYLSGWNDLQAPFGLYMGNSLIISLGAI